MKVNQLLKPREYKLFLDLDGVMSDLKKRVSQLIGELYSEDRFEIDKKYQNRMWKAATAADAAGDKFWAKMDLLPNALALWERISQHDVEILTATGFTIPSAADQKREWVARLLSPTIKVNITRTAAEKAKYAAPNHILIDDKRKALDPWEAAGGIGIHHADGQITRTFAALDELNL